MRECLVTLLFLGFIVFLKVNASPCLPRKFDQDSVVCVCNSQYCDYEPVRAPSGSQYHMYTSDRAGKRFQFTEGYFRFFGYAENEYTNVTAMTLDLHEDLFKAEQSEPEIVQGFGGAFTDAAGINYLSLSPQARSHLLRSYFGSDGIRYNLCRVPIASNDFSPRIYTYNDVQGDVKMEHFQLTEEDIKLKIPMILAANKTSGGSLQLIGSAWSAPAWMKDSNSLIGPGFLKPEFYQAYTDYLIKFLEHYKAKEIDLWAITTGNEPLNGLYPDWPEQFNFQFMSLSPFGLASFVRHLGPSLQSSLYSNTKILILDDQKVILPWYILLATHEGDDWLKYVHGIGVHWYMDSYIDTPATLKLTRQTYPKLSIINTEASNKCAVCLGTWKRAEDYAENIIDNMNLGLAGWIEFNLALNMTGGPLWHDVAPLDAPIIVNSASDEFYKQPKFYAIGHFSKFIKRGARVLKTKLKGDGAVKVLATLYDEKEATVVLFNSSEEEILLKIKDPRRRFIHIRLSPRSISTVLYDIGTSSWAKK